MPASAKELYVVVTSFNFCTAIKHHVHIAISLKPAHEIVLDDLRIIWCGDSNALRKYSDLAY